MNSLLWYTYALFVSSIFHNIWKENNLKKRLSFHNSNSHLNIFATILFIYHLDTSATVKHYQISFQVSFISPNEYFQHILNTFKYSRSNVTFKLQTSKHHFEWQFKLFLSNDIIQIHKLNWPRYIESSSIRISKNLSKIYFYEKSITLSTKSTNWKLWRYIKTNWRTIIFDGALFFSIVE